jgi:hypothetical protein
MTAEVGSSAHFALAPNSAEAEEYLRQLSSGATKRIAELAAEVTAEIIAQMPVYATGTIVTTDELAQSVATNLRNVIRALTEAQSMDLTRARQTGARRARQGVPLPDVLRAFRIGFAALWHTLLDLAGSSGETELKILIAAANTFWYLIDEYLEAVTEGYRESTGELVRAQRQRRGALLEALLSGSVITDNALWDVTQLLGLPHDGTFAVIAAETGEFAPAGLQDIEQTLEALGLASAWRLTPSYELGIVSLGSAERLQGLTMLLSDTARGRIGVSPAFKGLESTPRALHLAHVARSSLALGSSGAVCFDDSPLSMLIAAAPEESLSIARGVLRPVLEMPQPERDLLLDTFDTWVACGGSNRESAELLFCHPNTVRYRLARLQSELHRNLANPADLAELVVALRAWRLFGTLKPMA